MKMSEEYVETKLDTKYWGLNVCSVPKAVICDCLLGQIGRSQI
jgi:hypothetical protein